MNDEKYLTPKEQPVFQLDAAKSFEGLTDKEKKYAHYLSEGTLVIHNFWQNLNIWLACWAGAPICLHQTSPESPVIFSILQELFHNNKIDELETSSIKNGVSKEDFSNLIQYAAAFYGKYNSTSIS